MKTLPRPIVWFAAFVLALLAVARVAQAGDDWKAGTARVVITPDEFMWMSGYASRTKPAEGKIHDLWAKALAIEDPAGERAVIVTLDLVGIPKTLSDAVAATLKERVGLERRQIMFACSHTHSGPVVRDNLVSMLDLPPEEVAKIEAYGEVLKTKMETVAVEAVTSLTPAKLSWSNGHATFAVNRRNNVEKDVLELRKAGELKGPVDYDVPVLRVAAPDGTIRAIVFGYACHNTVLSDYDWCGDYAGFAQIEIERFYRDATAMFFSGCGADQNPLPRRHVENAKNYGRELAFAVTFALNGVRHPVEGSLKTTYALLDLPFDTLPTAEDIAGQLESKNVYEQRRARLLKAEIDKNGRLAATYPYPVQVWKLGRELTWVSLGGEVVVDYSIRLKRELGHDRTWITSYANDVMAYIPSRRVLDEGGYEGGGAMVYYGLPAKWAPTVEEKIVAKVHDLVREVTSRAKDEPDRAKDATDRLPKGPYRTSDDPKTSPGFVPTSDYETRDIEGWTVRVNKRLLDGDERDLGRRALRLLETKLYDIRRVVPTTACEKLQRVPIWLGVNDGHAPCAEYHPSREWLAANGFNPDKARAVEIGCAEKFLTWTHDQPMMVLHELAHAYHDQFLGDKEEMIKAAFTAAKESGSYEQVLRFNGRTERHYALSNEQEYFAESTEAYFGTNDYFPFVRAELKQHDPKMFEVLKKVWGE